MNDDYEKITTLYYYYNNKVTDFNQWKNRCKKKPHVKRPPQPRYKLLGKTLPDQDGDSLWVVQDNLEKRHLRLYFEELIAECDVMRDLRNQEIASVAFTAGAEYAIKNQRKSTNAANEQNIDKDC